MPRPKKFYKGGGLRRLFNREHLFSNKDGYEYKTTQQEDASRFPEVVGEIPSKVYKTKRRKKGSLKIEGVKKKYKKRTGEIKEVTKRGFLGLRRKTERIPANIGVNRPGVYQEDVNEEDINNAFKLRRFMERDKEVGKVEKVIAASLAAGFASDAGENLITENISKWDELKAEKKRRRKAKRRRSSTSSNDLFGPHKKRNKRNKQAEINDEILKEKRRTDFL